MGCAGAAGPGPLRRDRRLPARRRHLLRPAAAPKRPDRNFAITFLFVTIWIGLPFFSALLGNVFRPFNPWRAIGRVAGGGFGLIAGQRSAPPRATRSRLGRWPAAVGLLAFVWLEVIYGSTGGVAIGLDPHVAATAALVYSGYTLAMMTLFGVEEWCERGEVFSVYFGMFSQLAPIGVHDGRLGRRRPLAAAAHWATLPGSAAVVIASIASTSFDGAQEGAFKRAIESLFRRFVDAGFGLATAMRLADTVFLAAHLRRRRADLRARGARACGACRVRPSTAKLRDGFAHTLIPIALAYLSPTTSASSSTRSRPSSPTCSPTRWGRRRPTSSAPPPAGIDFKVLGANAIWYVQVGALIVGHVLGLTLAHDRALVYWPRLPPGLPLAVLDAGGDGRLHLLRPLPALGQRMTLPLAHLGHFLWIFYVIPVLIVIGGIIRSTLLEKRREKKDDPPGGDPPGDPAS